MDCSPWDAKSQTRLSDFRFTHFSGEGSWRPFLTHLGGAGGPPGLEAQGSKYQTQTISGDFGGSARSPWVTRSCPHPGLMVPVPFSG